VDEGVKSGLLDLVDHAREQGWSHRRAARVLEIDHWRLSRWIRRRAQDRLADLAPGGNPVHGLLPWEVEAILAVPTTRAGTSGEARSMRERSGMTRRKASHANPGIGNEVAQSLTRADRETRAEGSQRT
jgi:hypothetical protein